MLKTTCINAPIMEALAKCGHGDKILIADGNYPLVSKTVTENRVFLGLTAGVPTVTQVLEALQGVINIEKAELMQPEDGSVPPIFNEFKTMLQSCEFENLGRYKFYDACCNETVKLAISTGEKRIFANILITVGVA